VRIWKEEGLKIMENTLAGEKSNNPFKKILSNELTRIFSILLLLCLILGIAQPTTFLTVSNLISVLSQVSVNGMMVIGMTFVLLTGGIDISVGSVAAFTSLITAMLLVSKNPFGSNIAVALVVGIGTGVLIGATTGFVISKLRLQPFIVTLAMMTIFRGMTMVVSQGNPVSQLGNQFSTIGVKYLGPIPVTVIIMISFYVIAFYILEHTRFGRHVYAVGGNKEAARLGGINTTKILIGVYVICAATAAIAGMILASRVNSATPTTGVGSELDAIAGAVIGGVSLTGGKGKILGALIGVFIIGVLNNGLVLLNVDVYWTQVVKGLIILLAVIADVLSKRRATK
jgi:ribose transport system permease protein